MRVKILNKFWTLIFKPLRGDADGYCDPPDHPGKQIVIDSRLTDETRLRVICHEIGHAANWHASEEWVDQFSTDLARILWREGYRKVE